MDAEKLHQHGDDAHTDQLALQGVCRTQRDRGQRSTRRSRLVRAFSDSAAFLVSSGGRRMVGLQHSCGQQQGVLDLRAVLLSDWEDRRSANIDQLKNTLGRGTEEHFDP